MARFEVTAPNGQRFEITAPENASEADIMAYAEQQFAGMEQPKTELPIGQARLETAVRGGSLGAADMIMPTIAAITAKALGGDAVKDLSPDELFNMADEMMKQRRQQYRQERPVESAVAEVGASLPMGGAVLKGAQAAGLGAKGALAATGAVEGFGLAEGDVEERAKMAALGAVMAPATAAIFSKAAPATIRAVRKFSETAIDPVKTALGSVFRANPVAAREFMREGVPISALTVSDNPAIQRMGSILQGTFGSTNVLERNTTKTLNALTKRINQRAMSTGREITEQEAGVAIQRGVENYINKFQNVSSRLYGRVGRFIPDSAASSLGNTQKLIASEMAQVADAPQLQARIAGSKALKLASDALEDAGTSGLRYSNLRRYRTEIGSLIKQNVISGEDNALAKRIYGALTDDMKDIARAQGPEALKAFNNANAFYSQGLEQIEKRLAKYVNSGADPSRILGQLRASSKAGDFKLRAIMKAVDPADRPVIRDAVLQRIGYNSQNDFSTNLFFRDYNKISKEAKDVLLGGQDKAFRQSLDRLANISKRLTESARFTNTSRTADNLGNVGLIALGAVDPSSAVTAGVSANMAGRLLTNRSFAKILAKYSAKPITANGHTKMLKELEDLAVNNLSLENDITAYIGMLGASTAALRGSE